MPFAIAFWKTEFAIKQGFQKASTLGYLQIIAIINKIAQGLQSKQILFVSKKNYKVILIVLLIISETWFPRGLYLALKISLLRLCSLKIRESYAPSKRDTLISKFFFNSKFLLNTRFIIK